ncbi:hypothetical protein BV372_13810 [Nostoc sp. T09]|uniref:hypothetical protein n=1 Tax=Nostoc sp. T09 TaxID=1932621 RepID=UPI000B6E659A|nr:hypothetical protein [Nostoc sp. T09]OUL34473.1 hypothetical protein BV372_13810 [Nostoc sp. T09]
MSALKTDNVTVVVDICHSGGGKRGNFRVHSVEGSEELEYKLQWLRQLGLSPQKFIELRKSQVQLLTLKYELN